MKRLFILGIGLLSLALATPSAARAGGFTAGEIQHEAKALLNRLDVSRDVSYPLTLKLRTALEEPALHHIVQSQRIGAVFVVRAGEGGIFVKFMRGEGLVSFKGGRQAAPFSLTKWSAGAMVGGSAQWSVGLVAGIAKENEFGGDYTGAVKGATAAESHSAGYAVFSPAGTDAGKLEIYLISAGRGLSAGVGRGKMTITLVP